MKSRPRAATGHEPGNPALFLEKEPTVETKPVETKASAEGDPPRRVVKRYSNRKLYDTKDSRYVTLLQIAEMVREGEEVQIIDNNTKEDLTEVTLAQIIYEEQKSQSRSVPLQTLKDLLHTRTEKVLSGLREGPIGRLIPAKDAEKEKVVEPEPPRAPEPPQSKSSLAQQARETLDDWQKKVDERIRALVPTPPWQQLQQELQRLNARVDELEKKLKAKGKD
jgi:polyhydroxyalkanoate synthesis repressor PhaR